MPIMSGYDACKMIRNISKNNADNGIKGLLNIETDQKMFNEENILNDDKINSSDAVLIIAYSGFIN
jgi:hypothetical protein